MLAPFAWDARAAEHPAGCALAVPDVTVKRARRPVERLSIEHPSRRKRARRASAASDPASPSSVPIDDTEDQRSDDEDRVAESEDGDDDHLPPRVTRERRSAGEGVMRAIIMRRREKADAADAKADAADAEADVADVDADRRAPPHRRRRRARAPHRRFLDDGGPSDDDDLLGDDTDGSDVVDDDASVHTHSDASLERARGPKAESLFRPSEDWNSEDDAADDAAYFARRAAEGRGISLGGDGDGDGDEASPGMDFEIDDGGGGLSEHSDGSQERTAGARGFKMTELLGDAYGKGRRRRNAEHAHWRRARTRRARAAESRVGRGLGRGRLGRRLGRRLG